MLSQTWCLGGLLVVVVVIVVVAAVAGGGGGGGGGGGARAGGIAVSLIRKLRPTEGTHGGSFRIWRGPRGACRSI